MRVTIIGLLLGVALILVIVNFNSVSDRISNLVSDFNRLPQSFSLGDIFDGFEDTDKTIINKNGYILKEFDGFVDLTYTYNPNNKESLTEICKDSSACINSGFFLENGTHAGLLTIGGTKYVSIAAMDKQLTHIVKYKDGVLSFLPNSLYVYDLESDFEFQTGPLIVDSGVVRSDLINASSNGNLSTFRSFIGTNGSKIFIGITTKQVDLKTLGEALKEQLGENISVMNLDGGSSIAVYFEGSSLNSFGTSKILPDLLMIK